MFNIIKTPRNYFTCELLHDNLSNVAPHFNIKSLAAIFGGFLFGGSVLSAQYCPCGADQLSSAITSCYSSHACHSLVHCTYMTYMKSDVVVVTCVL